MYQVERTAEFRRIRSNLAQKLTEGKLSIQDFYTGGYPHTILKGCCFCGGIETKRNLKILVEYIFDEEVKHCSHENCYYAALKGEFSNTR